MSSSGQAGILNARYLIAQDPPDAAPGAEAGRLDEAGQDEPPSSADP